MKFLLPTRALAFLLVTSTCGAFSALEAQSAPRSGRTARSRRTKSRVKKRRAPRVANLARVTEPARAQRSAGRPGDFRGEPEWMDARLVAPSIYLDARLTHGVDDVALRFGPGVDEASPLPGEKGNCVVAAHRNVWGAEFWHLPRLKVGESVEVVTPQKRFVYRVRSSRLVGEHELAPLQAPSDPSISRLTLYTCTKPRTAHRFIVSADLEKTLPSTPALFHARALPFPLTSAPAKQARVP